MSCSEGHKKVWQCACSAPAAQFCDSCLLVHMAAPGSHAVSAVVEIEPFVCGMCKERCSEAVSYRYPVSICRRCLEAGQKPGVREQPGDVGSMQIELRGVRTRVEESLRRAIEEISGMDDVCRRAGEVERQVREAEEDLRKSREELSRLIG